MSYKQFVISDPHFGHSNILTFKDDDGNLVRPFSCIEEMDDLIVENWNKTVRSVDKVYNLGDVAMNRRHIKTVERLNGKHILIKGNHDIFKLKDYLPYFKDIRSYKVFPKYRMILSHIPIHTESLARWKLNVHGHLHNNVINDPKYLNVCVEHTNYTPVDLEEIIEKYGL